MKNTNVYDIINETNVFGTCYIGSESINGWTSIERLIKRIQKAAHNTNHDIFFTNNNGEWFTIKG